MRSAGPEDVFIDGDRGVRGGRSGGRRGRLQRPRDALRGAVLRRRRQWRRPLRIRPRHLRFVPRGYSRFLLGCDTSISDLVLVVPLVDLDQDAGRIWCSISSIRAA